jgi:hypothetical protein
MRTRTRLAVVAGAAALFMAAAIVGAAAQGGGGGRRGGFGQGRGGGGLFLLRMEAVQKELGMTQPQIDKLGAKQQEVMQAMREAFQNGGGGGGGQGPDPETMKKLQEIQAKAVADILDTKQQKRLHELELQQAGGNALQRPDVATALKLTDDQKTKVQAALQAGRPQPGSFDFQNATPEEQQQFRQKMQAAMAAAGEKALAVLTDAQRAQWKEMTGTAFKFPPMQFGRPGGGGRPPL